MNKRHEFRTGLIVGKFCPLHKGHELLINTAIAKCKKLYIISYTNPEFEGYEPEKREAWLRALYPNAEILVLKGNVPENEASDSEHREFCAVLCRDQLKVIPDAIFTSENYGDGFAKYMSEFFGQPVRHVLIGKVNERIITGTKIRTDIHGLRNYLSAVVYADFIKRVCFLGAESTGKSTLAAECAKIYDTRQVNEFGRTLWLEKKGQLEYDDMVLIAKNHIAAENSALLKAKKFLFVDTSPLTTLFYSDALFGKSEPELVHFAQRKYDCVFLCEPDFPLVQDGTRQDETFRMKQHNWYLKELASREIPYTLLQGSFKERIATIKMQLQTK